MPKFDRGKTICPIKIFMGVLEIPNDNILQSKIPGEIYIQIHITCVTPRIYLDLLINTRNIKNISGIVSLQKKLYLWNAIQTTSSSISLNDGAGSHRSIISCQIFKKH